VESIKEINPEVRVFPTEHAAVDPETLSDILGKEDHRSTETKAESPDIHYEMEGERHQAHGETYGMERFVSFGERYPDELFDGACVASFFEDLKKRKFGEVTRAKGIFRIEDGWIRMELASGQIQKNKLDKAEQSAVSIIGEFLNTAGIKSRLRSCRVE
jgi:G3E family GTPase